MRSSCRCSVQLGEPALPVEEGVSLASGLTAATLAHADDHGGGRVERRGALPGLDVRVFGRFGHRIPHAKRERNGIQSNRIEICGSDASGKGGCID